jgi:hypothetical protein
MALGLALLPMSLMAQNIDFADTKILADQGDAEAQYLLGTQYYYGHGLIQDHDLAFKYYQMSAVQGHASAQYSLGALYTVGHGIDLNDKMAFKYYQLAANQGDPMAQHNLGLIYAQGKVVPENLVIAYKWFFLARENQEYGHKFKAFVDKFEGFMPEKVKVEGKDLAKSFKPKSREESRVILSDEK